MARMKKFFLYFIMFIGLYLIIDLLTFVCMKDNYKDITNYEIKTNSPKIEITESKAAYSHGYIKGNIINDTGNHIPEKYLQIDLYNSKGIYLGTESKEIKYFNVQEEIKFDISYQYTNVAKIKISLVDEVVEREKSKLEKQVAKWLPVAGIITLIYLLP